MKTATYVQPFDVFTDRLGMERTMIVRPTKVFCLRGPQAPWWAYLIVPTVGTALMVLANIL